MRYNNYHKHDHISNIFTPDVNVHIIDYVNRAIELNEPNVWTTNHGSGGDIFEAKQLCDNNGLHCKFGIEGYIVPNPLEKDSSNYHIIIIPTTNIARRKLNLASSKANIEGYYYKPRFFLEDLLAFDKNELYITTACVSGLLKDEVSYNQIFLPLVEHFGDNIFVEVQNHEPQIQKDLNIRALWCKNNLGIRLIHANDSHYIYPNQSSERLEFLKGKGIEYKDEETFILDYPTYDEIVERYKIQGILSDVEIQESLDNTLLLDSVEDIEIDKSIKMPTIYPNLNEEEKYKLLVDYVGKGFNNIIEQDNISEELQPKYIEECKKELQVIYDTKDEIHTPDYFLLNINVIDKAVNEYGGVLTRTGRGSCGSFLLNKVIGITQIDRLTVDLPIYSDRFMSTARLLENRALPDIDFNIDRQEPFVKATRDLLGEQGCYPMIAYGTMKESEAFRNICRSNQIDYDLYNEVAKSIDNFRNSEEWKLYIEEAKKYIGTIVSASVHPCAHVLLNGDIREEIGVLRIGDNICAMITSTEADEWKYLKNDYLIVTVWKIIDKTYKLIGKPIKTIKQLKNSIDDDVWKLFDMGMTCTLNQVDGDWATKLLTKFKPRTIEEMAMFVSVIRPSFESLRDDFIDRKPYTTGSKHLDELFKNTYSRCCFQENIMRYFEWLGVSPADSIGIIKKISKKKIKQSDFDKLESNIREQWRINTNSYDGFDKSWEDMQSNMKYSFNSPHGLATALDCLYCAELKAHYPLEYYTTALNIYKEDDDKTNRLIKEMQYFGIKLSNIKFRYSNDEYSMDKNSNTIYKSVSSIKHIGKTNGSELYSLRNNEYQNFLDLLVDIKTKTKVNTTQLDILIKLDFFSEFGNINELLLIVDLYNKFYDAKVLTKSKLTELELEIASQCSQKITDKQLREFNNIELIEKLYNSYDISNVENINHIAYELGILGYTNYTDENIDDNIFVISDITETSYGTKFATLYNPKTAEYIQYKIKKSSYQDHPCDAGDIIKVIFNTQNKRKQVDGKWVEDVDNKETILKDYTVLKKFKED